MTGFDGSRGDPADLRYTNDHEWVKAVGTRWRVGLTAFAAKQLGDVVFVELPKVDEKYDRGEPFGSVESVKAVSEVYMPVSGRITAVNAALSDEPEKINNDPHGEGWVIEIEPSNKSELDALMSSTAYATFLATEQA